MTQQPNTNHQPPLQGRVQKYHSNFYYVALDGNIFSGDVYECFLKGLLKKEGADVWVGDRVEVDSVDTTNKTARIVSVLPRTSELTRPKVANIDQAVIVHAISEPEFDSIQLDRYLAHILLAELSPIICISKRDLSEDHTLLGHIQAIYEKKLGYPIIFTSVHEPDTLLPLKKLLSGKISVLAGLSGAGKSSLLNVLDPGLNLKTGEVSEKIERGQHTTRHIELLKLPTDSHSTPSTTPDSYLVDTPGFSNLKFDYVLPQKIESVYPEFAAFRDQCDFHNCLHLDESGCAVLANPDAIDPERYQSYREIIAEAKSYKETLQTTSQKDEGGRKTLHQKGKKELHILKLKQKARESARNTSRQRLSSDMDASLAEDSQDSL